MDIGYFINGKWVKLLHVHTTYAYYYNIKLRAIL